MLFRSVVYLYTVSRSDALVSVVKTLGARDAREQWENIFNKCYIQAVLGSLEPKVGLAMQTILDDDDEGIHSAWASKWWNCSGQCFFILEHDQLFFLAYERVDLMNQSSIQPHLWTYRSRITLEHLAQTLQEKKMKERYPILHEFLQAVRFILHTRLCVRSYVNVPVVIIGASATSNTVPSTHSQATAVSLWHLPPSPRQARGQDTDCERLSGQSKEW